MDYHIGIVAHDARKELVLQMTNTIGRDVTINWDDGKLGAGGNHVEVLKIMHEQFPDEWIVVLEDDALPVLGFRQQAQQALDVSPAKIVSFYLGTGYPQQYQRFFADAIANNPDACWIMHAQMRHAVAYAIHPDIATPLIIGVEQQVARKYAPDDAIGWWAMRNNQPVGYTNPSLVDHRDGPTILNTRMHLGHPSAPGRKMPRTAHKVGTRQTWNDNAVIVTTRAVQENPARPEQTS